MKPIHASIPEALKNFDNLPDSANVRLPVVCGLFGCSQATVWRQVRAGRIPKPQKLTPRTSSWNVGKLRAAKAALEN